MIDQKELIDDQIHPLDKNWAGIAKYVEDETLSFHKDLVDAYLRVYAEYILQFDREKAMEYIMNSVAPNIYGQTREEVTFIFRPKLQSLPNSKSTFAMKFKRVPSDNLDE